MVGLLVYDCEFEVIIITVEVRAGRGSLGVRLVGGAPSTCMQHSINAIVEGLRGSKLSR